MIEYIRKIALELAEGADKHDLDLMLLRVLTKEVEELRSLDF
jgi:hypothetical protein